MVAKIWYHQQACGSSKRNRNWQEDGVQGTPWPSSNEWISSPHNYVPNIRSTWWKGLGMWELWKTGSHWGLTLYVLSHMYMNIQVLLCSLGHKQLSDWGVEMVTQPTCTYMCMLWIFHSVWLHPWWRGVTGFWRHIQSDIDNCEGWLSPSAHSLGGRALTAEVRGPQFNPGWLPVFHSSLKIFPSLFIMNLLQTCSKRNKKRKFKVFPLLASTLNFLFLLLLELTSTESSKWVCSQSLYEAHS